MYVKSYRIFKASRSCICYRYVTCMFLVCLHVCFALPCQGMAQALPGHVCLLPFRQKSSWVNCSALTSAVSEVLFALPGGTISHDDSCLYVGQNDDFGFLYAVYLRIWDAWLGKMGYTCIPRDIRWRIWSSSSLSVSIVVRALHLRKTPNIWHLCFDALPLIP